MLQWKRSSRRRIMACITVLVMMVSLFMQSVPAYADEPYMQEESASTYNQAGGEEESAQPTIEAANAGEEEPAQPTIAAEAEEEPEQPAAAAKADEPALQTLPKENTAEKIDVWDFGAQQFDSANYNNKLTVDIMNSWYPGVEPGTAGKDLAGFSVNGGELVFNNNGKVNNRIRSSNQLLTRKDDKTLKSADGSTVYTGYLYSNSSATSLINLEIQLSEGDIMTLYVASNGGKSTICVADPNGTIVKQVYEPTNGSSVASEMKFYAGDAGTYKIYSEDEKLVVARILREHTKEVEVSGTITVPGSLTAPFILAFTNNKSNKVTTAVVMNGTYAASLREAYDYSVSLEQANGYVISTSRNLTIEKGQASAVYDATLIEVDTVTLTGTVTGLPADALKKVNLSFISSNIFKPEFTMDPATGEFTLVVEKGTTYAILAEGINDYFLNREGTFSAQEDGTIEFPFAMKDVYNINVIYDGLSGDTIDHAQITFSNINETDYSYTFRATEMVSLRNGTYRIKVTGTGKEAKIMQMVPDVRVENSDTNVRVTFVPVFEWDFAKYNKANGETGIETIDEEAYYLGLKLSSSAVTEDKSYLLLNENGSIKIPARYGQKVTINYCYSAAFQINNDPSTIVDEKSGSTSIIKSVSYFAKEDGVVTLNGIAGSNAVQTYLTKITVEDVAIYRDTITVGKTGCDFETINEALEEVKKMSRPNGERVTIKILPGNYEEMLVINVPNVSLQNASSEPSIELKEKGVSIDPQAVRITSYYGHGYSYYSMGQDYKYHEDQLAISKANGSVSYHNAIEQTKTGCYWNATVVVMADGFIADGIIFENSFNQYISEKEANDVLVLETENKGVRPVTAGDTSVQNKSFVERAAALAVANNVKQSFFKNCRFVGRQDTLFGGVDATAAFYKCSVMGACDFIFGGMTAVFYKCDLVMNTSEASTDVAYLTAAQQASGRGYLMYNCEITSTTPGVDTASEKLSKPGYFGRPWAAQTSEVVFFKTIIDATNHNGSYESMIKEEGWNSLLAGPSPKMYEYGTMEALVNTNHSSKRASWATTLTEPVLSDGTQLSTTAGAIAAFLGTWIPFELDAADDVPEVVNPETPEITPIVHEWDVTTLDVTGVTDKDVLEEGVYADYFKVTGKVTQRVKSDKSSITSLEIDKALNGAVSFTVTGTADVKVRMSSTGGSNKSAVGLIDSTGSPVAEDNGITIVEKTAQTELSYTGLTAGTYQIVSPKHAEYNRGARLYYVRVTEIEGERPERKNWSEVTAPVITETKCEDGKITASFDMVIGYDGADKVVVTLTDSDGAKKTASYATEGTKGSVTFTPEHSGDYTVSICAYRDELVKEGVDYNVTGFLYPLTKPEIISAANKGSGSVEVIWQEVKEATGYVVMYSLENGLDPQVVSIDRTQYWLTGLTVGERYLITIRANRNGEHTEASIELDITQEAQRAWSFAAFGQGVNSTDNRYTGNALDGEVQVISENGKGKLVPASTDGLAFYYTKIDPEKENFILTADVCVNAWKFSNGQEGFGLMACDAVGMNGDSAVFWNNSYMASVTKVEYLWDAANHCVSNVGDKITMKLGVGAQEKTGVTKANIADGTITANINELFHSNMATLDTSCAESGAGAYNLVGNYQNDSAPEGTIASPYATFHIKIQRDNTGYRISYTDPNGKTTTKLYYDVARNALTQIDENAIYAGFFASRNADISFKNIELTTSDPKTDPPCEEREITYITPSYQVISTMASGKKDYELVFLANADGTLGITQKNGTQILKEQPVTAGQYVKKIVTLAEGLNQYTIAFTPDPDYKPGEYVRLSNYEPAEFDFTVNYRYYNQEVLYVAPNGTSNGNGTKAHPLDIYTAVSYAHAGQKIVLAGGSYSLTSTVKAERGTDGTADQMIYLIADPESSLRPVFDFNHACAGMVFAGNYWYLQGFDVTNSKDALKGLQISGSHCTLDAVNAYKNGSTGIQISRYLSTDTREYWPAYNLILNCTSYGNADRGYEDADGFAAKLTVGEGNVFDGCIAYCNADDGWDLFAKIETGAIGKVTIKNSIAYHNGYLPDGTLAGNGNGFKLGGGSISGHHLLENCVAYINKAKGIDSNSCPDVEVRNCTTFNNISYNVALYTNDAINTDYLAAGIISYRTANIETGENIKPKGSQDHTKLYDNTNFYWSLDSKTSVNTENLAVSDSWFVSLDISIMPTRNADGTINRNGLLELTEKAYSESGARMLGTPSKEIQVVIPSGSENSQGKDPMPTTYITPMPTEVPKESEAKHLLDQVSVNGADFNETSELTLYCGGTVERAKTCIVHLPAGLSADAVSIHYTSSDRSVAKVTNTGRILAVSEGTAVITARVTVEHKTLEFKTKVTVEHASITFVLPEESIRKGGKVRFTVEVKGYDPAYIEWLTCRRSIAIVAKNRGRLSAYVSGAAKGTDRIMVRVLDAKGQFVIKTVPVKVK